MKKKKNTLLWEIKGKNIQSPCYVFGTMHTTDSRAFREIGLLKKAVDRCDAFAAEYDLDQTDPNDLAQAMLLEDEQTLDQLLSPRHFAQLKKIFKRETGHPLKQFIRSKPIMITNLLTEVQLGSDQPLPLDSYLHQYAKNLEKKLLGLESFEGQLNILKSMPIEKQLPTLKQAIKNFKSFRKSIKRMVEVYVEADLLKILKKAKKSASGMRNTLLYDRNYTMADRIAELGQEQSLFAAIGSGHLGGQKGVLNLLKQKGFEVKPAKY
ncbi:MAG: TraB/GumN family protein [Aureispira sp.]|nr:TraB/GumN family protein [Aureispira sp.]